jgi:imidazolonepropionase-like amidohydrolase
VQVAESRRHGGGENIVKQVRKVLVAGVMLAAVQGAWAQDATIVGARVAVGNGPVIPDGYVLVRDGHITEVGPGRPAQAFGVVIDARGMTALPGLLDGHKHINTGPYEKEQMADLIEHGFTTVLAGGGPADGTLALARHIDSGAINGPHVLASGSIFGLGQMPPEKGREGLRALAAQGVKFTGELPTTPVPSATPAEVAMLSALVDEGKKVGVEVMVHAVSTPAMVAATDAGVRHQVHLPNKDFMGFDDAAHIAGTGTIVLDLISFGAPVIDVFAKDDTPRFRTGLRWPESIAGANRDDKGRATGTEGAYTLINARRLWDASHGKALGFGSDQSYPVRDVLEHELKSLMVMFSMHDVVRILTINTATFLNLQDQVGTLEPRKRADILLVQGNPFDDFHALLDTVVVLKDGKVVVDKRAAAGPAKAPVAAAGAVIVHGVGALTAQVARPEQAPVIACAQLASLKLPQGRVQAAKDAPASAYEVPASTALDAQAFSRPVPAHCQATVQRGTARKGAGTVQVWLPNAGWSANLLWVGAADAAAVNGALAQGYAVATGDAGSSVHDGALIAKALAGAYYGATPRYVYRDGRGAGVAQVLAELQVNPADFDGVVVGSADAATTGAAAAAAGGEAPDLSAFAGRGGKIIEYQGGGAQPVAADGAIKAYEAAAARNGGMEQARNFHRLFIVPSGQKGDSYRGHWVSALDEWVQRARTPDMLLVDHVPAPNAPIPPPPAAVVFEPAYGVHTVCAWPLVGQATSDRAESPVDYICVPVSRAGATATGGR